MNYHSRIMNIRNTCQNTEKTSQVIYAHGHRDARHAAAELAIAHDQEMERVKADLDRLHRERDAFQDQCRVMAEENARYLNMLVDAGLLEQ